MSWLTGWFTGWLLFAWFATLCWQLLCKHTHTQNHLHMHIWEWTRAYICTCAPLTRAYTHTAVDVRRRCYWNCCVVFCEYSFTLGVWPQVNFLKIFLYFTFVSFYFLSELLPPRNLLNCNFRLWFHTGVQIIFNNIYFSSAFHTSSNVILARTLCTYFASCEQEIARTLSLSAWLLSLFTYALRKHALAHSLHICAIVVATWHTYLSTSTFHYVVVDAIIGYSCICMHIHMY